MGGGRWTVDRGRWTGDDGPWTMGSSPIAHRQSPTVLNLVHQPVHHIIDAELVPLVRFLDRYESRRRELPVVRDVGIEVDHHHQPFRRIVVLEDPAKDRPAAIVVL